ncbi:MAG: Lrp/AsnC family transcriptional regulator [Candidatus Woesearchaeota archaeon]
MDKIDKDILDELQKDSSRSISQLAKYLGLPRTTLKNRINRLEKQGIIIGYRAIVDWEKLGFPLCNYFHLNISYTKDRGPELIAQQLKKIPGVEEVHMTTGRWDLIAKIRMKHISDISKILDDPKHGLLNVPSVFTSESSLVIKTFKEE